MKRVLAIIVSLSAWFLVFLMGASRSEGDVSGVVATTSALLASVAVAALTRAMIAWAFGSRRLAVQLVLAYLGGCIYRAVFVGFGFVVSGTPMTAVPVRQWLLVLGLTFQSPAAFVWFLGMNVAIPAAVVMLVNAWGSRRTGRDLVSEQPSA